MKRIFVMLLVVLCAFGTLSMLRMHSAFASPIDSCPSTPVPETTGVGYGSTAAYVSITIWKDCDGYYYASANSVPQANGAAFTGTLTLDTTSGKNPVPVKCGVGICNTPHTPVDSASYMLWHYEINNGWQFYNFSGDVLLLENCQPCDQITSLPTSPV
jgi:hypothetical protein